MDVETASKVGLQTPFRYSLGKMVDPIEFVE